MNSPLKSNAEPLDSTASGQEAVPYSTIPVAGAPGLWGAPPSAVGDYDILRELGRGGMGVAFEALDRRLNRRVALKMISFETGSQSASQRLLVEAEAAAKLQHPGIVQVFELGTFAGRPFIAMELCDGGSLAGKLDGTPVPGPDAARVVETLARAVGAAHREGIVHRDLKPSNVFLAADGAPKVGDFGLAKLLGSDAGHTHTGAVMGTPSYMAPEQAAGGAKHVGPAADVYSLGAILYELLTGRPPFKGPSVLETLEQVRLRDPVPVRDLNPKAPRDLETIALTCLAKEPRKRYATAAALADDLGRFLRNEPVLARPVGPVERARRWSARNPGWAALGCTVFAVSLLAAVSATLVAVEMRDQRNAAKLNAERATKAERTLAVELGQSLVTQAEANRASTKVGRRHHTLDLLAQARDVFAQHEPDNPARRRELREQVLSTLPLPDWKADAEVRAPNRLCVTLDGPLERYAVVGEDLHVRVRRFGDGRELLTIPPPPVKTTFVDVGFQPNGPLFCANFRLESSTNVGQVWDLAAGRRTVLVDGRLFPLAFHPTRPLIGMTPEVGGLNLVNLATGETAHKLCAGKLITDARFSPDGRKLAVAIWNEPVQIFDAETLALDHAVPVVAVNSAVGWSSDGRLLALGTVDGSVTVWNVPQRGVQSTLDGHSTVIVLCDFAHGGYRLLTTSWDLTVRVWDAVTGKPLLVVPGAYACFSGDGRRYAVLDGDVLRTGGFDPGDPVVNHPGLVGSQRKQRVACDVRRIDYSPDGSVFATCAFEGVRLWEARTGRELGLMVTGHVEDVRFHPGGGSVVTYGNAGIYRWPITRRPGEGGAEHWEIGPPAEVQDYIDQGYKQMDWVDGGRKLAANDNQFSRVEVFDPDDPRRGFDLPSESNMMTAPSASPDGRWLTAGVWGGAHAFVWHLPSRALVAKLPLTPTGQLSRSAAAFNPDGRSVVAVASAATGSAVRCWRVPTWEPLWSVACTEDAAFGVPCFSPDGRLLAVPRTAGSLALVDAQTGEVLADWRREGGLAPCPVRFSPDGRTLAVTTRLGTLELWDLGRVREQLAALNLDWPEAAPIPRPGERRVAPPRTVAVRGDLNEEFAKKLEQITADAFKMDNDPKAAEEAYRTGFRHFVGRYSPHDATAFRYATERNPKHPDAYYQLAKLYAYEKNWAEAFRAIASHLALRPADHEALLVAATLANRLGRSEESVSYSSRLLELEPGQYLARRERAAARIRLKAFDAARNDLDDLIRREPFDPRNYALRAACFEGLGQPDDARRDRDHGRRLCEAGRVPADYANSH